MPIIVAVVALTVVPMNPAIVGHVFQSPAYLIMTASPVFSAPGTPLASPKNHQMLVVVEIMNAKVGVVLYSPFKQQDYARNTGLRIYECGGPSGPPFSLTAFNL